MKYVGLKQVIKSIENGEVTKVYIGEDAEENIKQSIIQKCEGTSITVEKIETMEQLGKLAGIEVKAATAAE